MKKHRALEHLEVIFAASLKRADPYAMIGQRLSLEGNTLRVALDERTLSLELDRFQRLVVLGAGKASARMALAVERLLGERISGGAVAVKPGQREALKRVEVIEAGHPIPDAQSVRAGREIARLCREADESTLFINLISGGGSALLSHPLEWKGRGKEYRLTLEEQQEVTRELLACGATIQEVNCVRKHLSGTKGGRLAQLMHPATSINLILSDVVGDRLDSIASGITTWDNTTFQEAMVVVEKYRLQERLPSPVMEILRAGLSGLIPETPKRGDTVFQGVHNVLIGSNLASLLAARECAERLGYHPVVLSAQITGESREIAKFYLGVGKDVKRHGLLVARPACIIAGGETTVTLRGRGKGGRNQEMALALLVEMAADPEGCRDLYFLAASTDGNDGPTDAAGAFASLDLLQEAKRAGLEAGSYLQRNDSYHFFQQIGALLKTGSTGTNVCDLQILIVP